MRYDYYFCIRYQQNLIDLLNSEKIKYKVSGKDEFFSNGKPVPVFVTFTIRGYSPIIDCIVKEFRREPQISVVYSSAELNQAQLLCITPKKHSIDVSNDDTAFSYECVWKVADGTERVRHRKQNEQLAITKEPSVKGQTAFWNSSTGASELFTDRRVYELANAHDLCGFEFLNTTLQNGVQSKNIFQLVTHNVISSDCILFGEEEQELCCPMCGRKQYAIRDVYQLRLKANKLHITDDFYATEPIFGIGITYSLHLISQRFYQILKENRLIGSLQISPVELI